jgi:hypothetical protein
MTTGTDSTDDAVHVRYLVEVTRLHAQGVAFRSAAISGPGGRQIVRDNPAGT